MRRNRYLARPGVTAAEVTLADVLPGEYATVLSVAESSTTSERFMEMGLVPGTRVQVIRYAPLGDPLEIAVRGYRLSLRRDEAVAVLVQREGAAT